MGSFGFYVCMYEKNNKYIYLEKRKLGVYLLLLEIKLGKEIIEFCQHN